MIVHVEATNVPSCTKATRCIAINDEGWRSLQADGRYENIYVLCLLVFYYIGNNLNVFVSFGPFIIRSVSVATWQRSPLSPR